MNRDEYYVQDTPARRQQTPALRIWQNQRSEQQLANAIRAHLSGGRDIFHPLAQVRGPENGAPLALED